MPEMYHAKQYEGLSHSALPERIASQDQQPTEPLRPAEPKTVRLGKRVPEVAPADVIGGMRRPDLTADRVPGWKEAGSRIWSCCFRALVGQPEFEALVSGFGNDSYHGPSHLLTERLCSDLSKEFHFTEVTKRTPLFGEPSAVNATVFTGLLEAAGDPDAFVLRDWLVNGAPLGIDREIEYTGIFPRNDSSKGQDLGDAPDLEMQWHDGFSHYPSVKANHSDASREFDRYLQKKFAVRITPSVAKKAFPKCHVNKLGLIIKVKRTGERKVRLIVDMKRSLANSRTVVPERPILPRALDPIESARASVRDLGRLLKKNDVNKFEFATADFEDAYCHINHHDEELRNCLVAIPPTRTDETGAPDLAVLCKLGFGSKGGPDVWSRFSAACGRITQAIRPGRQPLATPQARINIYLDDPFWTLFGDKPTRDRQLGFALMVLLACGFRISWRKGTRGESVDWIGLLYTVNNAEGVAAISIPRKTAEEIAEEAKDISELHMVPLSRLRKFTGRASWVMNIIPRTRWAVQRLWAAVTKQEVIAKSHRAGH
jgi:hypothetical protein